MPLSFLESILKKNCAIYYSFLLFESTFPKLLWINHKVLVQQDIYLEKPFPMMWMYFFFQYRLCNSTTCLKIVQLDIIFDLRKKFRQVIQIFALIQKCTRAENDLAIGKKYLTLDYTLWNFRRKKWWVQSILKLFWKDYHDVINEGLKVHLSLILITGVKTNKPAY